MGSFIRWMQIVTQKWLVHVPSNVPDQTALVDSMAVVNQQTVFKDAVKNRNDFASYFVQAIDRKGLTYESVCVVFDDYSVKNSLKATTQSRLTSWTTKLMIAQPEICRHSSAVLKPKIN